MNTKYRIGLIFKDGYKCWAKHPPLYKRHHADAAAKMAWIGGATTEVTETVIVETETNEPIARYDGEWRIDSGRDN